MYDVGLCIRPQRSVTYE